MRLRRYIAGGFRAGAALLELVALVLEDDSGPPRVNDVVEHLDGRRGRVDRVAVSHGIALVYVVWGTAMPSIEQWPKHLHVVERAQA